MMSQAETSNTQRCQNNNLNMMINSQGHNQSQQQHQPTVVQGLNVSNSQPSINPINTHSTYQQQYQPQQQQPQVVQPSNVPNTHSNVNPLDLHTMYQKFQQQKALFAKQQEKLKQ